MTTDVEEDEDKTVEDLLSVVQRFDLVSFGDSWLQQINVNNLNAICTLQFDYLILLKEDSRDKFDRGTLYEPAIAEFRGLQCVRFSNGDYCQNVTVIGYEAEVKTEINLIEFRFTLTGGFDNDTFMRQIAINARDFELRHG